MSEWVSEWVSECWLTPTQQYFSYIMASRSYFAMRWRWGPLCTRSKRLVYRGGQLSSWRKPKDQEKTTDLSQVTDNIYHIMLYRVHLNTKVVSSNRHMARCTRYNTMWYSLSVTFDRSVVLSGYPGFLHQQNWSPRYIAEILLKVALNIITLPLPKNNNLCARLH